MYSSTTNKLLPGNRFDPLQVFATSSVVVSNLSRRGDDGVKMLLLSAMHESSAMCTVPQRAPPKIDLRTDPNPSVPGGNPQSSSFEEAAYITTNPERA